MFPKLLLIKKKWMMLKIVDKNVFKTMTVPNDLKLIVGFKTIILCPLHSKRFVKTFFSAKIWFVKTSTKVVKNESRTSR